VGSGRGVLVRSSGTARGKMKNFSSPAQPPAPQIKLDDNGHSDGMATWTAARGLDARVYELNLDYGVKGLNVRVYTSARSFTWSQVEALGVDFRRDDPRLRGIKVTALLPYASMDDLVSGHGPMAMGTSWRRVESDEVILPLPTGFKAAPPPARPGKFDPGDRRSVPACPSPAVQALGVGDLRPSMANTWVTVRGPLGLVGDWCTETGCWEYWVVVDAGNPRTVLRLRYAECGSLDAGDASKPPQFEVMATGLLLVEPDHLCLVRQPRYVLDQVRVCAILPLRKP